MSTTDSDTTRFMNDLRNVYGRDIINAIIDGRMYFMWLNNMDHSDSERTVMYRILCSNTGDWNNIQLRERILWSEAQQIRHLLRGRERFTRDITNYCERFEEEEQEIENIIEKLTTYLESNNNNDNNIDNSNNNNNNNISG